MKVQFKKHFPTSISITELRKRPTKNGGKKSPKGHFLTINLSHMQKQFLFLLLKAIFFLYSTYFFIPTSKLCLGLLKKPKEHLNCALGTAFLIKSKTHAHSHEKMAFSINFVEIALVSNTSMKLVYSYVFLITYFHHNHYLSPNQSSETHKG